MLPGLPGTPLLWIWGAGAACVLLLLAAERWRLQRWSRTRGRPAGPALRREAGELAERLGIRSTVEVRVTEAGVMPVAWGVFRPRILLPAEAAGWPATRRRTVLLHELAHLRRRDPLSQAVAAVACAVHWFHPLVWWAASRMKDERERAADDLVIADGAPAPAYARELLGLARELSRPRGPEMAAVTMARPSRLPERIDAILDRGMRRGAPGRVTAAATALAGGAVLVLLAGFGPAVPGTASGRTAGAIDLTPPERPKLVTSTWRGADRGQEAGDPLPRCWRGDENRTLRVESDGDRIEVVRKDDRCTARILVRGELAFDEDFSRIVGISRGGRVVVEERDDDGQRRYEVRRGPSGGPVYESREDGGPAVTGPEAARAVHSRLAVLFRYGGVAAEERAARILGTGGEEAVLDEVARIPPDVVAATYLRVLLRAGPLSAASLVRTAEIVAEDVGADHAAGKVLAALLAARPGVVDSPGGRDALGRALASVGSDATHVRTLLDGLGDAPADRPELLRLALRSAEDGIGSDAEMVRFLSELAARDPGIPSRPASADGFWKAAGTIGSDVEHTRLLRRVLEGSTADAGLLHRVLVSAEDQVGSDGEMARFLLWTVRKAGPALLASGPDRAFREALESIGSDGEERRVAAALRRAGLERLLAS